MIEWETYALDCQSLGPPNQHVLQIREGRIRQIAFGPMFPSRSGFTLPGMIIGVFDFSGGILVPEKTFVVSMQANALGGNPSLNLTGPSPCDYKTAGELIFGHTVANGMCCHVSFGYDTKETEGHRPPLPAAERVFEAW